MARPCTNNRAPLSSCADRAGLGLPMSPELMEMGLARHQLRPEFEGIRSQLYNRENPLTLDDTVSQLMTEESPLQEMKGGDESSACAVSQPRVTTTQPPHRPKANRRGPIINKDNL